MPTIKRTKRIPIPTRLKDAVSSKPSPNPGPRPNDLKMGPRIPDRWTEYRDVLSAKPHPRPTSHSVLP